MMCPTEFTCAVFAEGELPEAEAREVARHLENCEKCGRLVSAFRGESRMLVQYLQDIDLGGSSVLLRNSLRPLPSPSVLWDLPLG